MGTPPAARALARRALARAAGAALAAPAGAGASEERCEYDPDPHVVSRAGRVYAVLVGYAVRRPDLPQVSLLTSSVHLRPGGRLEATVRSPVPFLYTVRVRQTGYVAGPRGPYEPGTVRGTCAGWAG